MFSTVMEEENIDLVLQHALLALLDVKPKDPINFLATHFQMECETSNLIAKAVNMLQNMTIQHPALDERLLKAYSTISQYNDEQGLTGEIYSDLLVKLIVELPPPDKDKFLLRMQCRSTEYVSFTVFRSGVLTCLLFNQFIDQARVLFNNICGENHDFAPAPSCRKALKKLSKTLNQAPKDFITTKTQETGISLGISELSITIKKSSTLRTSPPREYMRMNGFISEAIDVFLQEVPKIK